MFPRSTWEHSSPEPEPVVAVSQYRLPLLKERLFMFHLTTCPTCQTKISIPEEKVGRRYICPHCQSPFVAGKSAAVADAPPDPSASYNKTMLTESKPPIKFPCPRCKTPLEMPAEEAGRKRPCPACGQRLLVPDTAPAPAPAAPAGLNKTMLVDENQPVPPPIRYNCPNCKKPLESPASEAGTKKPCPSCGQRLQVPAATPQPTLNKTMLASQDSPVPGAAPAPGGARTAPTAKSSPVAAGVLPTSPQGRRIALIAASGLFLLLLLGCIIPAVIRGGKSEDVDALAKMKEDLKKLTEETEKIRGELAEQNKLREKLQEEKDKASGDYLKKLSDWKFQTELAFANERYKNDKEFKEATDRKLAAEKERLDEQKRLADEQRARAETEVKKRFEDLERQLRDANQKSQTIIQQPPPVMYYPPYHPRFYWPFGW
jgi:DNA-directed RNA polymerase subunit RPC12/RpoP